MLAGKGEKMIQNKEPENYSDYKKMGCFPKQWGFAGAKGQTFSWVRQHQGWMTNRWFRHLVMVKGKEFFIKRHKRRKGGSHVPFAPEGGLTAREVSNSNPQGTRCVLPAMGSHGMFLRKGV